MIPCRLLAAEIAPILAEIFRQSLHDGVIPSIWKNADVATVFKKGGRDTAENYRPISLTCICYKILEHIISFHFRHHLDQYGILSPYQHGFRKLYSCERIMDFSLPRPFAPGSESSRCGTFVPWNFCTQELSLLGTFAPWNFCTLELSLPPTNVGP